MTNRQPLQPHQAVLEGAHLHRVHRDVDDGRCPPYRFPVQEWTHLGDAVGPTGRRRKDTPARRKPDDILGSHPKSAELGETQDQGRPRKTSGRLRPPHRDWRRPGPKGGPEGAQGHLKGSLSLERNPNDAKKKQTRRQDKTPRRHLMLKCTYQKTSRFRPH
jgi:hypothetical protein